jgi:hypothetical protein
MPGNSPANYPIETSIPRSLLDHADEVIERPVLPARLLRLLTPVNGTQRHSPRNHRLGPLLGVERE